MDANSSFDLRVDVFKAVRAPLQPAYARAVLVGACSVPEVAARLAGRGGEGEVCVRLTGDRELRRLNRSFLGEDHATDVLSFPSGDLGPYLGLGALVALFVGAAPLDAYIRAVGL